MKQKIISLAKILSDLKLQDEVKILKVLAQSLTKEEEEELAWAEREQDIEKQIEQQELEKEILFEKGWESRKFSHEDWLKDNEFMNSELVRSGEFEEFMNVNLHILDRIIKQHGGAQPKNIGSGTSAGAWELGDGTILKATVIEPSNYQKSADIVYEDYPFAETEMMVHEIGKFHEVLSGCPLYYVIVEKLINTKEMEKIFGIDSYHLQLIIRLIIAAAESIFVGREYEIKSMLGKLGLERRMPPEFEEHYGPLLEGAVSENSLNDIKHIIAKYFKSFKRENMGRYSIQFLSPQKQTLIKNFSKELAPTLKQRLNSNSTFQELEGKLDLRKDWLEKFIEQIVAKNLSGRDDLHEDNVGLRNVESKKGEKGLVPAGSHQNYFVFFDF